MLFFHVLLSGLPSAYFMFFEYLYTNNVLPKSEVFQHLSCCSVVSVYFLHVSNVVLCVSSGRGQIV